MGIPSFNKLWKDLLISQTSVEYLTKVSEYKPLNLYIDLPIILFSGCIVENKKNYNNNNNNNHYDECLVAQTAFKILNSTILHAYEKFLINKTVCYIHS